MGPRRADLFGGMLADFRATDLDNSDTGILDCCHLRAANPSTIIKEWVDDFMGSPEVAMIPKADTTYFYTRR
jgi:hypothetical protein